MKTEWDYTALADAYLKRPDYAKDAINDLLSIVECRHDVHICDIGAGTAHLTLIMAKQGFSITAIEPNDAMRTHGIQRTLPFPNVIWFEGTGEHTGQPNEVFDLVTFGSSFNVTDRAVTLKEVARILKPQGWVACMWNHRQLDDPIQAEIESIITARIPNYSYGSRREDQTDVISQSNLFGPIEYIEKSFLFMQKIEDCIEAWRSHGTLQRQAGDQFSEIIQSIAAFLHSLNRPVIEIPYITRIWAAQKQL